MTLLPPATAADLLLPSRRHLLKAASATIASMALPGLAQTSDFWNLPRELWLYRPSTHEMVKEVYWADGKMVVAGYVRICQLLRDTHTNQAVQFDLVTLDIARGVCGWIQSFGIDRPLVITSGYRSHQTQANEGGPFNSLHTLAQAIDMRIEGVSTESLTRFGVYLSGGGVGFYPRKQFTHLDRGRIRYWRG